MKDNINRINHNEGDYEINPIKKVRYNIGDTVYVNNLLCKILFGTLEKGFFSFYEVEDENNQIYSVNSKNISKKKI